MTKARDIASAIPAPSTVSSAELGYLDGVTSAIQTQIDAKQASSTAVTLTGTQTLTNKTLTSPVIASVINNTLTSTTGDIIYASGANTPARLGIGSTSQVLTVASGIPSWAAPAGGGANWSLLNSGGTAMTGAQNITITGISGANQVMVLINGGGVTAGANYSVRYRINTDSGSNYTWMYFTPALTEGGYYTQDGIVQPDMGATTASRLYSYLLISGANASGLKNFQTYGYTTGVTTGKAFVAGGYWNNSATVSSVTIRNENAANWTAGTIYVYTSAS